MSNHASKSRSVGFLSIVSVISALVTIIAGIPIVIQLVRGNIGLVSKVLLVLVALGVGYLWLNSFYFYFKRVNYAKWVGRLALAGMIATPALAAVGYAGWKYYQSLPPDKIIILVADFDGKDQKTYRVTGNIVEQLREATKKYPDVQVEMLRETITYEKDSEYARKVGKDKKASIVLWGEYAVNPSMVQVNVNFEVLRSPSLLNLRQQKEALNVTVAELESFKIQAQLSREMSYLVLLTVGLARYEANDYDSALDLFTDALKQEAVPQHMIEPSAIYFYRGNIYYRKGNLDQAIADFNKAIELKPDYGLAYLNRGVVYAKKGQYDKAIAEFNKAIELKPDDAEGYYSRGIVYANKGQYDQAIADFNKAIGRKPYHTNAYVGRGVVYDKKGHSDIAIANYSKAIELKPDYGLAYYNRGIAHENKGDLDSAIKDYTKAIEIKPDIADAYNNRGNAYSKKGDLDSAIKDYTKAIEIKPDIAHAYNHRGVVYGIKGQYDQAIADYSKAIELKPDYADTYYNRGIVYRLKGDLDLAIADFNKAIELNPNYPEAYNERGGAFSKKGQYDQAIKDYSKAIELKPDYALAYYNRGYTHSDKGEYVLAIADYNEAIKHKPDFLGAYFNLGLSQRQVLDHNAAVASLKQGMKIGFGSNQPYAVLLLADSLRVLGRSAEAEEPLQETLAALEDGAWKSDLLKLYLGKATPEAVLQKATKAKEKGNLGPSCEAGFYVGLWYLRLGEKEKAKALFKQSLEDRVDGYIEPPMAEEMLKQMQKVNSQK